MVSPFFSRVFTQLSLRRSGGTGTLNGTNTLTGLTTIGQGGLIVNSGLAGSVSVSPFSRFILNGVLGGGVSVAPQGLFTMNGSASLAGTHAAAVGPVVRRARQLQGE